MIDKFFYLIWTAMLLIFWIILFIFRIDLKKEMLFMSIVGGIAGVIMEFFYTQDWWRPITVTGTLIGIEDFFQGFFVGGIAAIIYEGIYKKKIRAKKNNRLFLHAVVMLLVANLLFLFSFYFLNLNSAYSSLIGMGFPIIYIWIKRRDLIKPSLVTGLLMTFIGAIIYSILFLILPNYFQRFWFLPNTWYSYLILGIPLAEYMWFFLVGVFMGPLYEFWQEGRLVKK